ncbi:hypothetical protein T10_8550 [Trichinella papuae]|uniref:Uncharacterized protein n=1 Tax=Trichinella papuae TaxID=268474 RepID=A0A0V1MYL9_9BILA|nr:hypothetical protein T10_8550 [Trichinella papuae]
MDVPETLATYCKQTDDLTQTLFLWRQGLLRSSRYLGQNKSTMRMKSVLLDLRTPSTSAVTPSSMSVNEDNLEGR